MNIPARTAPQQKKRAIACSLFVAVRKGLEPSTSGVTGRHSNQLNYRTRLFVQAFSSNADTNIGIISQLARIILLFL